MAGQGRAMPPSNKYEQMRPMCAVPQRFAPAVARRHLLPSVGAQRLFIMAKLAVQHTLKTNQPGSMDSAPSMIVIIESQGSPRRTPLTLRGRPMAWC